MKMNKSALALAVASTIVAGNAIAASKIRVIDEGASVAASGAADHSTPFGTANSNINPIKVDTLWTAKGATAVDFDDSAWPGPVSTTGRQVAYVPDIALVDGSTLKFEIANGAVQADTSMFLVAVDLNGANADTPVTIASLNDFTADSTGNYTSVTFQVDTDGLSADNRTNNFAGVDGAALGAISAGDPLPSGIKLFISKDATGDQPVFVAAKDLSGTTTITLTEAKDDASNPLQAPLAASEALLSANVGVKLTGTKATSTINVEAATARTEFVTSGTDTPNSVSSIATLKVTNTSDFGLDLDAGDTYVTTVSRDDVSGVTGITFGAAAADATTLGQFTSAFDTIDFESNTLVDISINDKDNNNTVDTAKSVVKTGDWSLSVTINPDKDTNEPADLDAFTLTTVSHDWDINGMQAKVPYAYTIPSSADWNSVIKFTNESGQDSEVLVDAVVYNPATGLPVAEVNNAFTGVEVATVASKSQASVDGVALAAKLGLDANTNYHFGLTFTVIGPQNSVHIDAQNKSPNGRAAAAVLYNINETTTCTDVSGGSATVAEGCATSAGRVWQ